MELFTPNQWVILILVFLLGLFLGMAFLAGGKWKRRYRDEVARREALETENEQLRRDAREMESLRHAAAKTPHRDRPLTERELTERELRERELAERELTERELRDRELTEREIAEREAEERALRERELRDRDRI